MEVSSEYEFALFLGVPPTAESRPDDGLWIYELPLATGLLLVLSFDVIGASIRTQVRLGPHPVSSVFVEGARSLRCDTHTRRIHGTFSTPLTLTIDCSGTGAPTIEWAYLLSRADDPGGWDPG